MIIIDMTRGWNMNREKELIDIRRKIHMYPEIAFDTKKTDELITGYLKKLGITILEEVSYPGVVGLIKGRSEDKVIAIRADTDALPIREENDVSYRSRIDGAMHGCGHDIHIACLLGAAKILSESR
jgi:amidohydrolase